MAIWKPRKFFPTILRRNQLCWHLDLGLKASRTMDNESQLFKSTASVFNYGSSSKPMQNASNRCFGRKSGCTSMYVLDSHSPLAQEMTQASDRKTLTYGTDSLWGSAGTWRSWKFWGKNEHVFSCQSYVVYVFVCGYIHALCVCVWGVNEVMAEA